MRIRYTYLATYLLNVIIYRKSKKENVYVWIVVLLNFFGLLPIKSINERNYAYPFLFVKNLYRHFIHEWLLLYLWFLMLPDWIGDWRFAYGGVSKHGHTSRYFQQLTIFYIIIMIFSWLCYCFSCCYKTPT